jgi:hypothetical protein
MEVINYTLWTQSIRLTGWKKMGKGRKEWKLNQDMQDENAFV